MSSSARVSAHSSTLVGTFPVYSQAEGRSGDFLTDLKASLRVHVVEDEDNEIVFDVSGVDAPIANALRRILLAEVPSVAIEDVYYKDNTSIMQEEVLAHRLGLIPLDVDPMLLEVKGPGEPATALNTLVFTLDVTAAATGVTNVYSSSLVWCPQAGQAERFEGRPPRPVDGDILICKLKPFQRICVEVWAVRGIGSEHAKWSPVCTASYRLLPDVRLKTEVRDAAADELVAKCPMGVFDIEDLGGGGKRAVVARSRNCSLCRECIRESAWADRVALLRVSDHFIFSVESTGAIPARELVRRAFGVLTSKAQAAHAAVTEAIATGGAK